jgi:phage tail sheath protein FI
MNYLCALPIEANQTTGNNANFLLSNYTQNASAPGGAVTIGLTSTTSVDSRKFVVPFQGGQDGIYPNRRVLVGTDIVAGNTQGYDLSSINAEGYSVYADALNVISNQDEYDINMIVMPGVIDQYHSAVVAKADDVCNDRGDAFLIFDAAGITANIATATTQAGNYDSNYAATYYPWVKIFDANINKPVWVPPSVVLPGVLAFNDRVAAEWYAPAGLNRGGLSMVLEAYTRLTHAERDDLYEGRVNPIATFPGQGVVVWGQKTLQAKPSALDRINVRRLLIAVKKYIASATKYLVFEQNTAATRNRFLNIVNPYLESIQQRQGLYGFRVVMDETNNTPDLIDRNIMYGQIYLQPAKTAEFIIIDFNILPTGAAFPGA